MTIGLDGLNQLWAKARGESGAYHPLLCHMIDVSMVARAMWDLAFSAGRRQGIANGLGLSVDQAGSLVAFWAGLHDIGKASPTFQALVAEQARRLETNGWTFDRLRMLSPGPRHGVVSALALKEMLVSPFGHDGRGARKLGALIGGHHGVFPTDKELTSFQPDSANLGTGRWQDARRELAECLADILRIDRGVCPAVPTHALAMELAGLVSVADWIGSDEDLFPYWPPAGESTLFDLETYVGAAEKRADAALRRLGWTAWPRLGGERTFTELFGFNQPNPTQIEAVRLGEEIDTPSLVVIEAPMGEGKTEAALYLADRWSTKLDVAGCYIALPTQATSNQMFGRVRDYLLQRYPDYIVNMQLIHGHASLSAAFLDLKANAQRLLKPTDVRDEEGGDRAQAGVVAADWFTYRKRGLLAPFGVGTVDQILLGALQTRHFFVRHFGLARKTIVIDEVHAYDTYMSVLLERLLEWLAALGSPVILLSATLPNDRRVSLMAAYRRGLTGRSTTPADTIEQAEYPRVSWITASKNCARQVAVSSRATKEVRLAWRPHELPVEEHLWPPGEALCEVLKSPPHELPLKENPWALGEELRDLLAAGGCVAIICNTVRRAQAVFLALRQYFPGTASDGKPELELFHARYLFNERDRREKQALLRFGKEGAEVDMGEGLPPQCVNRPHRAVLVATAVIEQSLDLDFDLMITDLAPVDLMLQRAGRLHRHDRTRPSALKSPTLWILGPTPEQIELPIFEEGGVFIYHEYVLLRSWLALRNRASISIPDDVGKLVESVYDERIDFVPLSDDLQQRMTQLSDDLLEGKKEEKAEAKSRWLRSPNADGGLGHIAEYAFAEDSPDLHPAHQAVTRLTDPTVSLIALWSIGDSIYLDSDGREAVDLESEPGPQLVAELLRRSVTISHYGVVTRALRQPVPTGWHRSPLLRHSRKCLFDQNRAASIDGVNKDGVIVDRVIVRLDPDLGFLIKPPATAPRTEE